MKRDHRKRGPDGTLQARVFRFLKRCSATPGYMAKQLDVSPFSVGHACGYLVQRGLIVAHRLAPPLSRHIIYTRVPGASKPKDLRGHSPGSRSTPARAFANLVRYALPALRPAHPYIPGKGGHPLDAWANQQWPKRRDPKHNPRLRKP